MRRLDAEYNRHYNILPRNRDSYFTTFLRIISSISPIDSSSINDRIKSYINLQYHDISIYINRH